MSRLWLVVVLLRGWASAATRDKNSLRPRRSICKNNESKPVLLAGFCTRCRPTGWSDAAGRRAGQPGDGAGGDL